MSALQFNANEVFTMAKQIELNGAAFYRAAAERLPASADLLTRLAMMEDSHYQTFSQLHATVTGRELEPLESDPENQGAAFAKLLASENVFDFRKSPEQLLANSATLVDVLKTAIGLEKESVIFYLGIKEMMPRLSGRDRVDQIIKEEMNHIRLLNEILAQQ